MSSSDTSEEEGRSRSSDVSFRHIRQATEDADAERVRGIRDTAQRRDGAQTGVHLEVVRGVVAVAQVARGAHQRAQVQHGGAKPRHVVQPPVLHQHVQALAVRELLGGPSQPQNPRVWIAYTMESVNQRGAALLVPPGSGGSRGGARGARRTRHRRRRWRAIRSCRGAPGTPRARAPGTAAWARAPNPANSSRLGAAGSGADHTGARSRTAAPIAGERVARCAATTCARWSRTLCVAVEGTFGSIWGSAWTNDVGAVLTPPARTRPTQSRCTTSAVTRASGWPWARTRERRRAGDDRTAAAHARGGPHERRDATKLDRAAVEQYFFTNAMVFAAAVLHPVPARPGLGALGGSARGARASLANSSKSTTSSDGITSILVHAKVGRPHATPSSASPARAACAPKSAPFPPRTSRAKRRKGVARGRRAPRRSSTTRRDERARQRSSCAEREAAADATRRKPKSARPSQRRRPCPAGARRSRTAGRHRRARRAAGHAGAPASRPACPGAPRSCRPVPGQGPPSAPATWTSDATAPCWTRSKLYAYRVETRRESRRVTVQRVKH